MDCASCIKMVCRSGISVLPENCPMKGRTDFYENILATYTRDSEINNLILNSTRTESAGYGIWNRLEEIMQFCKRSGFRTLGLAFCTGLFSEASVVKEIFSSCNFQVYSVACKNGGISKNRLGLEEQEKVRPGKFEAICNPVAQAEILNELKTELNVVLGLCVGHDSLFFKYSRVPVTVLAVKDRVLAHNPLGAVYGRRYQRERYSKHKLA